MLKKLAVGLQAVSLCVVVSFFATEMKNNASGIVGGWCVGNNDACHRTTSDPCTGEQHCTSTKFSNCNGGTGGGGYCKNNDANNAGSGCLKAGCDRKKTCYCEGGS